MAGRVATVTALLLLVITRVSGGGQPSFFYSGAPAPVVPQLYVYDTQLVAAPVAPDPGRSATPLPCPAEGFYRHPTNCSRFYRCVDYAGTGQFFSRYEFQCPLGQMFLTVGKDTCVPDDCAGVVPVPTPIGTVDPGIYGQGGTGVPPSNGQVGDDPSLYPQPVIAPHPIESGAPAAGGAYPQPGGSVPVGAKPSESAHPEPPAAPLQPVVYPEPVTPAPRPPLQPVVYPEPVTPAPPPPLQPVVYPEPVTPAPPPPPPPPPPVVVYPQPGEATPGCPARYVQDPLYCNIYHRCPDDSKRYVCIASTVFDQARQMCRIDDQENVCVGKKKYSPPATFRADYPFLTGSPDQFVGEQNFPSFSQGQSLPLFRQGQPFQSFIQGESLPLFSEGQPFQSFIQGEPLPLFSQGQSFPSFDQGQTFQSFDQEQNFPPTLRLVYPAQVPSYTEVSGVPQFAAPDFASGQGASFYAQPSYVSPNYLVTGK